MAELTFQDLSFEEKKDNIKVNFLRIFYFNIPNEDINKIGNYTIEKNKITFKDITQKKAERKFYALLEIGFKNLKNSLNNKPTVYIHKNSNIPLIGNVSFGLVDRDTNIIEVKPITSCNIKCIYCSVDEDKRPVDFVIEKDYLVEELKKLILLKSKISKGLGNSKNFQREFKNVNNIEAHIASQGEPLLYTPLTELVRDISKIKQVKTISIDTNGTLLTKEKVDELINAGLTRFNFSINSLDEKLAGKIAGMPYNTKKTKEICKYIAQKVNLIITPVFLPDINDKEMENIIKFAKEIEADIGIQNFLNYKMGRNPIKQLSFEEFYKKLEEWQKKYKINLIKTEKDFNIEKTTPLKKPFKKGEIVEAEIVCIGRLKNEKIAVAKERTISIPLCDKEKGKIRVKITRIKHNIFIGAPLNN